MSYKENWLRHLFAGVNAEPWSRSLARDFWDEDLWEPATPVRFRWLKMIWVYSASVATQITLPGMLIAAAVSLFKPVPFRWWLIGVGGMSAIGLVFAVLFATAEYINQRRKS